MIRTALYVVYIFVTFLLSIPFWIPYVLFLPLPGKKLVKKYVTCMTGIWARNILFMTGSRVKVSGRENLPPSDEICLIGNHQGSMDIPLVLGYIPRRTGFIAKKELRKVPVLNLWMIALHCIFIDRKNARKSLAGIHRGIARIKEGNTLAIFPEGTRSRGPRMNPFKTGNLKLIARAGVTIVPLTLNGTYRIFEESHRIRPSAVTLHIHPAVQTDLLGEEQLASLPETLQKIIASALPASPGSTQSG
ncbi:1-acyl-sn-glycerol-3-phosphate acyltransferase [bacterium]|nr:1-acyl-sn-glycerol-3-phosphate acyltransferase [bacterium]